MCFLQGRSLFDFHSFVAIVSAIVWMRVCKMHVLKRKHHLRIAQSHAFKVFSSRTSLFRYGEAFCFVNFFFFSSSYFPSHFSAFFYRSLFGCFSDNARITLFISFFVSCITLSFLFICAVQCVSLCERKKK